MTDQQNNRRLDLMSAATIALVAAQLLLALAIWLYGPSGPIAVHFDLHNRPNGWADRRALAMGMGVLAVVTLSIGALVRLGAAGEGRTLAITRALLLATAAMVTGIFAARRSPRPPASGPRRLPSQPRGCCSSSSGP